MSQFVAFLLLLLVAVTGCVTKAEADARVRRAFLAGQQYALQMQKMEQARGPTVTIMGPVKNPVIPWTEDLTLAKAIIAAEYEGPEPGEIILVRQGQGTRIDPVKLLSGEDVPLNSGDIIHLK